VAGDRCLVVPSADDSPELDAAQWAAPDPTVHPHLEVFTELAARVQGPRPPGRPGHDRAVEQPLLDDCWLLACYEELYRGGRSPAISGALARLGPRATAGALRALAPRVVRDDLWRLTAALAELGYDQLAALGGPVTVAPLFVQAWADGDLVLGRTLVDVKVTKNSLPLRDAWLDQLLGYVLLDHGDWYDLEQVAIYLGRQAQLVAWPLSELLPMLTGDPRVTLAGLRDEFHGLLRGVWADETQVPFQRLWVTRTPPPSSPVSRSDLAVASLEPTAARSTEPSGHSEQSRGGRVLESRVAGRSGRIRTRLSKLFDGHRQND
jgi:hypothetical protein